jgi:serine phosphatase RsbU (regulator of sigma subunit)
MAEVAGDFYDYLKHGDGRLGILVADVSGHGVPAAIIASMVKIALAAQVDHADDPARVVTGMNRALCGKFEAAFITATYAFLNPGRGHLAYAAAGHPPILLQRPGGAIESLEERGLPIGIDPGAAYTTRLAHLDPGDRLWLYTDGLLEAADPRGTFFGDQQILESLKATGALELPDSVDRLIDDLSAWRGRGASLNDDVTVLAVDLREGAA